MITQSNIDYKKRLKDLQNKFRDEIYQISREEDKDIGVATAMFRHRYKDDPNSAAYNDINSLGDPLPSNTRDTTNTRSDILRRGDAIKQATSEISPQYARILNQLKENIASARQSLPQALGSRGQAIGGQRSAIEQGLTRTEAYQTADIGLREEGAIQNRATEIMNRNQEMAAAEQARLDALRQQEFNNKIALRAQELTKMGIENTKAYQIAMLENQDEDQQLARDKYNEDIRRFGIEQANKLRDYNLRLAQLDNGSGTETDLRPFINAANNLTGNARVQYVNNLSSLTPEERQYIKEVVGVASTGDTSASVGVTGRVGGSQEMIDIPGREFTISNPIVPEPDKGPEYDLTVQDHQKIIDTRYGNMTFGDANQEGNLEYNEPGKIKEYIESVAEYDPAAAAELRAANPIAYTGSSEIPTKESIYERYANGEITEQEYFDLLDQYGY